jgi:hypothetical protein
VNAFRSFSSSYIRLAGTTVGAWGLGSRVSHCAAPSRGTYVPCQNKLRQLLPVNPPMRWPSKLRSCIHSLLLPRLDPARG